MDQATPAHLQATELIDCDHAQVKAFAHEHAVGADDRQRMRALYLAVRDLVRYNPYHVDLTPYGMKASTALTIGRGWCVPKAALLTAAARAAGVPARVGYADVRNHLSTERLRSAMQSDLFIWHGYSELWLGGGWVKATPAFNIELCERFGILALEWDGESDSLYHPFDRAGRQHMEYVAQRGSFDDVPLARIQADFAIAYPRLSATTMRQASFDSDVRNEQAPR